VLRWYIPHRSPATKPKTPAHLDWIATYLKLSDDEVRALIRTPALDAALSHHEREASEPT
jgi:hypothetical protein